MNELDILGFESSVRTNGEPYWFARQFSQILGYTDYKSFQRVIDRAIKACATLNIPALDNFQMVEKVVGGQTTKDIKLSRFACYLVAMNADSRKEEVAAAQAYLASLATAISEYVESVEQVERLVIRGDLSDEEKSLQATAHTHHVTNYAFFHNAGYRGMYNMNLTELKELKGIPSGRSPLDFMHSEELAANLFRITQTNAKIRNDGIIGQKGLENTAKDVGRTVRDTMITLSGTPPERLPAASDIKDVKAVLRSTQRVFKQLDDPSKKKTE